MAERPYKVRLTPQNPIQKDKRNVHYKQKTESTNKPENKNIGLWIDTCIPTCLYVLQTQICAYTHTSTYTISIHTKDMLISMYIHLYTHMHHKPIYTYAPYIYIHVCTINLCIGTGTPSPSA
jgi:hypothetical protein